MTSTPGHIAVTGNAEGSRSAASHALPVELPASSAELAPQAAAVLGWGGVLLPETRILGRAVCVAAQLRADAHAERIAMNAPPAPDRATAATWAWPELAATTPEPAVDIRGVLAIGRHWPTAMAAAVPFARYGTAAMLLPTAAARTTDYVDNCLPRARAYGLAIVTADVDGTVELDLAGHDERLLLDADAVSRWVNEVVYGQLLADTEADAETPASAGID